MLVRRATVPARCKRAVRPIRAGNGLGAGSVGQSGPAEADPHPQGEQLNVHPRSAYDCRHPDQGTGRSGRPGIRRRGAPYDAIPPGGRHRFAIERPDSFVNITLSVGDFPDPAPTRSEVTRRPPATSPR